MGKLIKHVILEFLYNAKESYNNDEITRSCMAKYPDLKPISVTSVVSMLSRDGFLDRISTGPALYRINKAGIEILVELERTYIETCDYGCYIQDEDELFNKMKESELLKIILSFIHDKNRWVTAKEMIKHMNLPNHYVRRISKRLVLLHEKGLIDRKRMGKVYVYSLSKDELSSKSIEPHKTEKKLSTTEKILKFILDEHRWVSASEVTEFMGLSKGLVYDVEVILLSLYERGYLTKLKINKNVNRYHNDGKRKYKGECSEDVLNNIVEELISIGVEEKAIYLVRYESLGKLIDKTLIEKRENERNYLRENNFIFLEDFESMEQELAVLEQEVNNCET